jgi:undecaprenyl-diphosphatase
MLWWQAVVLAFVQAVTEFLPVSSSGHLILVPHWLGWKDQGLEFDIATNTGTLLAVVIYFRRELTQLLREGLPSLTHPAEFYSARLLWALLVGTVPAGLAGLWIKDWVATEARSPLLVGTNAVVYGLLLGLADRFSSKRRQLEELNWKHGLVIGAAQALALVPGTSRSGITMTAALALGYDRRSSAQFSFLLSVPIGAALGLKQIAELSSGSLQDLSWKLFLIAAGVSGLAGYLVIAGLLRWLRERSLLVFMVYRIVLGLILIAAFS